MRYHLDHICDEQWLDETRVEQPVTECIRLLMRQFYNQIGRVPTQLQLGARLHARLVTECCEGKRGMRLTHFLGMAVTEVEYLDRHSKIRVSCDAP